MHTAHLSFDELIRETESAIEQGLYGVAHRLFDECCRREEEKGNNPEFNNDITRLASGLLLLTHCELERAIQSNGKPAEQAG